MLPGYWITLHQYPNLRLTLANSVAHLITQFQMSTGTTITQLNLILEVLLVVEQSGLLLLAYPVGICIAAAASE